MFTKNENKLSFYDTARKNGMIFPELEKYFDKMIVEKSPCSVRAYQDSISRFLIHFNIHNISGMETITLSQLIDFQDNLRIGLNYKSVNSHILRVKSFWNNMVYREFLKNDVISKIKALKKSINKNDELDDDEIDGEIFILTEEEIQAMINNTKDIQLKLTIVLMNEFGLRRDETSKILCSDIKEEIGGKTYLYVIGKGNKKVKFVIKNSVLEIINEANKLRTSNCKYLFYGQKTKEGITGGAIFDRVIAAAKNAGISEDRLAKVGAHTLRRGAITRWAKKYGILVARDMARHSNISTTQIYAKVTQQDIDKTFLEE